MKLTIFSKKRKSAEGRQFNVYLANLKHKDGSEKCVQVRFKESCPTPKPEQCPMNILVAKENANLSTRDFIREDTGLIDKSYTLWINEWQKGEEYIDKSLDDYEFEE